MASNIEIKARVTTDRESIHARAAAVSDSGPTLIEQEDTFFIVPRGRLKLREFGGEIESVDGTELDGEMTRSSRVPAELIFYERPDTEEPTASSYSLVAVPEPAAMKASLSAALGVRGVVRKRRSLYIARETRIHIDEVDGLGTFLELEVVLPGGDSQTLAVRGVAEVPGADGATTLAEGVARCRELMSALGVDERDLVDGAYIDLLEEV